MIDKAQFFAAVKMNSKAVIYLFSSLMSAFLGFIMLRYFTKYLDTKDYGIFGYVTAVNTFLMPLFTLNFNTYYIREYYLQKSIEEKRKLLGSSIIFTLIWSFALVISLTLIGGLIFDFFSFSFSFFPYMFLTIFGNILIAPVAFLLLQYRLLSKAWLFFAITTLQSVLVLGIGFFFVSVYEWGVYGRIFGVTSGSIILGVICIIMIRSHISFSFEKKRIRDGMRFCLPLIPYTLILLSFDMLDRFFLERYNGDLSTLGLYNVGFQYASAISMFTLSFYKAYEPEIFRLKANDGEKDIANILTKLNFIVFFVALVLILLSNQVFDFLTNGRFEGGETIASYLIIAFYFKSAYTLMSAVLSASAMNKHILVISVCCMIVLLLLSFIFLSSNQLNVTISIKIIIYVLGFVLSWAMLKRRIEYLFFLVYTFMGGALLLFLTYLQNRVAI